MCNKSSINKLLYCYFLWKYALLMVVLFVIEVGIVFLMFKIKDVVSRFIKFHLFISSPMLTFILFYFFLCGGGGQWIWNGFFFLLKYFGIFSKQDKMLMRLIESSHLTGLHWFIYSFVPRTKKKHLLDFVCYEKSFETWQGHNGDNTCSINSS